MNVMRTTVATVVAATLSMSAFSAFAAASLTGAGATFPAPVYAKWADTYQKETGNKVNYQGIGSSGGVKQIIANTVDFGASDAPLADDKLTQEGLFQFPTVIGGVVLAVNLPGVKSGELVLDGKTLGDIYLGKIKKWDDEAIAKLNPGLKLPSQNIAVVRRADGSGTSFVFTSYLSKVNEAYALGTPKWKMISAITLKASVSGIMTGILLAIARIAGETAPLLFTALSNQFWSTDMMQPIANLPVTIFKFAMSPFAEWQQLAWAGVLIITLCVLLLNILARVIFAKKKHG
ncbi:phosphate ABC transporter substrate-binding protein PstS [Klebsiella quasipneumoniae subsp. quasipneumoniae]